MTMPAVKVRQALGEEPIFQVGDQVRISVRFPIGHYRVPVYIRGKRGSVEMLLKPMSLNNEEEGYGRNAGNKGHYYRVGILLSELWPEYSGPSHDRVVIEVFQNWLERI
jgi:nitrile hydratase